MTNPTRRHVHWNGELVPADEARVSVFDAGFLYGDGVYETMRAYGGKAFALSRHLDRLARSAGRIRLEIPPREEIATAIERTLAANGTPEAIVRVTVTRGVLTRRLDLSSAGRPSVLVTTDPVPPGSDEELRRGISVVYSKWLRLSENPLADVKSTNYQVSLFARNEAREAGAREVLAANESGEIVEAAAANVFLVEENGLVTPPLRAGILGGITREIVLELAAARGLAVSEATLPRERIAAGREVFLSGTSIRVAPVVRIDGEPVGDGRPGPTSLALLDDYLARVRDETGAV
jgi:branched-chain amino acid aminotransferase